ncbi:MAG: KamA family radical SAM protein [Planctomycetaceae bacterium]|jgi:EF-P beta-lysylation protein EpmB|nr:KamA family radical SAM protein [Planctomycetaceae bacterium]
MKTKVDGTNINWKDELSQAVTELPELFRMLGLPTVLVDSSVCRDYPLFVPRSFVDKMRRGDSCDPLLLQILPRQEECAIVSGFSCDPLAELPTDFLGGSSCCVLKKYAGRVLLPISDGCGIHCRFCFRRFFPKLNSSDKSYVTGRCFGDFETVLAPICSDNSIEEVILSGGDPLLLDDGELDQWFYYIAKISHVKRIRIHTRLPVILPSRLTPELVKILSSPFPTYLVLHVNHPNELGDDFWAKREDLRVPVILAQTVLLRGINDNFDVLYQLFDRLISHRIIPYYLHQLDRVQGAAHFEVSSVLGRRLLEQLRDSLPGYAIPRYVREVPGMLSKQEISACSQQ